MAYIGSTPTSQNFISGTDYFNGTGSQTAFTLTRSVNSVNDVEVVVNNVIQQPNSYTISGTTLTLSAAPSSGTSNVYVRYLATNQQSFTVGNNTVGYNQLTADMQSKFAMKNRIINGAMVIHQRGTAATADAQYSVDRWRLVKSNDATESASQNTDAPAGFNYSLRDTISTGDATIAAAQYAGLEQYIEGYNIADLNWGSANAKTVTLSFWIRSSVTGQYTGNVRNSDDSRIFPFNYTISVANTWEYKTVTITGETSGTWLTTNGIGLKLALYSALGSNYTSGTNGAWGASPNYGCGTPVNGIASNGNIFAITGVQLEVGSSATGFEYRQYQQELALCQRYYQKFVSTVPYGGLGMGKAYNTTTLNIFRTFFVPMRTTPSTFDSSAANTFFGENSTVSFVGSAIGLNPFTTDPYQGGLDLSVTGATAGAYYIFLANNNAASYIAFGAEL